LRCPQSRGHQGEAQNGNSGLTDTRM
jgi:hypothetical protein